jgi:hypothetical protein
MVWGALRFTDSSKGHWRQKLGLRISDSDQILSIAGFRYPPGH